jgi:hypothetical protein
MTHYLYAAPLEFISVAIPSRVASRPLARPESRNTVRTNVVIEKLHSLGLISIVDRIDEESSTTASRPLVRSRDLASHAAQ